jgi:hypothetical protein
MKSLFNKYEQEIKEYCDDNGLDFSKAKKMGHCWGKNDLIIQYVDYEKGKRGLLDETPAPVVLEMEIVDGKPQFKQTQYTKQYLS